MKMTTCSKIRTVTAIAAVATLGIAAQVRAEGGLTLEERVQRLERRGELPPAAAPAQSSDLQERLDALEAAFKKLPWNLTIGGMVVGSYQYDLNDPEEGHNNVVGFRAFDRDHNTFTLDLFQLQVSRAPGDGRSSAAATG